MNVSQHKDREIYMRYLAKTWFEGGKWLVAFPGVPGVVSAGDDLGEALDNAQDVVEVMLLMLADRGETLPDPVGADCEVCAGEHLIAVSATTAAKLAFIRAFDESGLSFAALAARLGKAQAKVERMRAPFHRTKVRALEAGLAAMGKRLVVRVEAA
jgi:antitoxin HicB